MKRNLKRVGKFISIFYPRSIYKILAHFYSLTNYKGRSEELISIIADKKFYCFLELGVWTGVMDFQ